MAVHAQCICSDYECGFWSFECKNYTDADSFPQCNVTSRASIGNGVCDGAAYNVDECGYDGGDCCQTTCDAAGSAFKCKQFDCADPDAPIYVPPPMPYCYA